MAWSLADQVLVSVRNFLLLLVVIRTSEADVVGAFGLLYTTYFLLMAVVRGFGGDPLVVRSSGVGADRWRRDTAASSGLVVLICAGAGVVLLATSRVWGTPLGAGFAALGVVLVPLLLQDHLRLALFADGRPREAATNDTVVLTVQLVAMGWLFSSHHSGFVALILAWGAAAAAGCVLAVRQTGAPPALRAGLRWFKEHRDLGPAFAADAVANRGAEQVANIAVAALAGLAAVGALTAARTLFAPLTTIQTGVNAFVMPEVARRRRAGRTSGIPPLVTLSSAAMGTFMLVTGVILWFLPDSFGRLVFGDGWDLARSVLVPMTAFSAVNAVSFGYWSGLKALAKARRTLFMRAWGGVALVAATAVGATRGAVGAAWGMTIATGWLALWLWWGFHRSTKGFRS